MTTACQDTTVPNLNDPIIDDFISNPTPAQVQAMAYGLLRGLPRGLKEFAQVMREGDGFNQILIQLQRPGNVP